MRKIFMLSMANIRKTKGNTLSLFIMFLIAALLVNAGLLVFINFGNHFDKLTTELNTSTAYYIVSSDLYNDQVEEYLSNGNILDVEKEESLWFIGEALYNQEKRADIYLLNDASKVRNLSQWKFVGEHLPEEFMSIYLPYRYHQSSGYQLGDLFEITIKDTKLTFTIKGFIEDAYFSSTETGVVGAYLPHDTFVKVSSELSQSYRATLIFTDLQVYNKDIENSIKTLTGAENLLTNFSSVEEGKAMFTFDLALVKTSRVMMATMVSLMIVAFAIIIVSVCLIVIRFRIGNSIEDDMSKIGSLKALGYTSRQIISSVVIQFLMIAFVGSVTGILLSYLTTPMLSDVFAAQSGIKWEQGFDGNISSIALGSILMIVVLVSSLTARRINKLHPIVALRGGLGTHNFRRNYLPLSQTIGSLPVVLAIKSTLQNMKQSIMIVIILIAVSFAGTFAVVMFYNTVINPKTFLETPGVELSNIIVTLDPNQDNSTLIQNIESLLEVRKVQFIDQITVKVNEDEVIAFVMDDYTEKETNTIYEGRYPLHYNEVALSGYVANLYNKQIGEWITIKYGDTELNLLITGLTQGAFMSGKNISLRTDSVALINPDFKQQNLQVYINKEFKTENCVELLEDLYGDSVLHITNADKSMQIGASAYISIVAKVGIFNSIITVAIVILVLYFVVNSSIIRRKREIGIQKAIGFSTLQLMNQISLGFLVPIILGVSIGSILGITQTNPMMSVVQRAMGIMKANYIITPLWIVLFGLGIVLISYITSMLLTYRVRKISAYSLVTE